MLRFIARYKKEIILSTGMSNLTDIENALNVLTKFGTPLKKITVLHCNSAYPTAPEDVNLKAMTTIKNKFGVSVGFSDHSIGIEAAIIAVSLGAKIIEKHLTLNKKSIGPDHAASIEPNQFKDMVLAIRSVEKYLGNEEKNLTKSESVNRDIVRKSIVALKNIAKGEKFSEANITTKKTWKWYFSYVLGKNYWKKSKKIL